jgi:hypothetical protein
MIDRQNRDNASNNEAQPQPERRVYAKPVLIDLGDVRELTRGGSGGSPEAHSGGHS